MQCLYLCVLTMCGMTKTWCLMFVSLCVYNVFCDIHYLMCICDRVWQSLLFGLHLHSYAFTMDVDDMLGMYFEMCARIFLSIWFYLVSTSTLYVWIFTIFYVWWSKFDMQMLVCIYNFVCVIRNLMGYLYACVFAMLLMFECLCICNACVFVLFLYLESCL